MLNHLAAKASGESTLKVFVSQDFHKMTFPPSMAGDHLCINHQINHMWFADLIFLSFFCSFKAPFEGNRRTKWRKIEGALVELI